MNTTFSIPHSTHRTTAVRVFSAFSLQAFRLSLAALFLAGTPLVMAQTFIPLSLDIASKAPEDALVASGSTVVKPETPKPAEAPSSPRPRPAPVDIPSVAARSTASATPIVTTTTSKPAAAPDDDEVIVMGVFDVRAERDSGYMSTNVESATRLDASIVDIPQNIVVFTQDFLQDILARNIDDVIMYDATVIAYGDGWGDEFAMRGMGGTSTGAAGTNFYNGFEQQSGRGAQSLINTERVEMIKGPNAVLYGQGAFGGTVSRTSKKPQFRKRTWMHASVETTDYLKFQIDHQDTLIRNKLAYRINAMYTNGHLWDDSPRQITAIAPSLRWRISKRTDLILEYSYQHWKGRQGYSELPIFNDPRIDDPTNGDPFHVMVDGVRVTLKPIWIGTPNDHRIIDDGIGYLDFRHTFSRYVSFRAMFNSQNKTVDYLETHGDGMYAAVQDGKVYMSRLYRDLQQSFDNYRTRAEIALNKLPTGFITHTMIAGMGWENLYTYDRVDRVRSQRPGNLDDGTYAYTFPTPANRFEPVDLLTHVTSEVPWTRGNLPETSTWRTYSSRNFTFYFSDLMSLLDERLFVQFGLRYSNMRRHMDDRGICTDLFAASPAWSRAEDEIFTDYPLTHSAGLVYHLTKTKSWTVYANNNATFVPNYRLEYSSGPPLKPMTGNQLEVGFKYVYKNLLQLTACYYDIKQRNVPTQIPVDFEDPETGVIRSEIGYTTIDDLHSKGCELQLNLNISNRWRLMLSYSYTDCTHKDPQYAALNGGESRHERVPLHGASALTSYRSRVIKGLQYTLGVQWRDTMLARYTRPDVDIRYQPSWTAPRFLDLMASAVYDFKIGRQAFKFRVNVRNLTNEMNSQDVFNVRTMYRATRSTTFALESTF